MSQVHKENLTAVDNALPNRAGLDIEIFGMEGIPEDIVQQHNQRVLTNYHQAQADRQSGTGTTAAGAAGGSALKKPKLEATTDLKKRLAEHKAAKLAAEQGDGRSSGGSTPQPAASGPFPGSNGFVRTPTPRNHHRSLQVRQARSPSYQQYQQPYTAPSANGSYGQPPAYPTAASGPGFNQQAPYASAASPSQPGYGQPLATLPYPQHQPYAQPPQPSFQPAPPSYPPQTTFSSPPYQNQSPYPGPSYSPTVPSPFSSQPGVPPRPFGAVSPNPPYQQQYPSHMSPTTPNHFPQPVRTGSVSLPNAPGLPQRPAFGAPPVSGFQFQQMHQGQILPPQPPAMHTQYQKQDVSPAPPSQPHVNGITQTPIPEAPNAASIDDLISSASKQADATAVAAQDAPQPVSKTEASAPTAVSAPTPAPAPATATKEEAGEEKSARKDKDKPKTTRLVYSDNETSPEEKMATLPRYAFTIEQKSIMA